MLMLRLAAAVIAFTGVTSSGFAADLTDEELLKLFQNQRDAFLAAQQSGTGQTRGLTLVTVDSVQATTLAPSLTTPGQEDTATAVPTTDGGVTVMAEPLVTVEPLVDLAANVDAAPAVIQPVVFGALAPELQINLNIRFPFDSATLTPDQKPVLTQMCKVMRASDIKLFRIVGHTDSSGSDEYNQKLSQ
ncbi:MAG TPA: OmpA family protein, partial [Paracoccaceae bacterium]